MSINQINNNINPHGKPYTPGKHIAPLEKTQSPHLTKSLAHPLLMKSLSLWKKNFNLLQKKHSAPPDVITSSLKKSSVLRIFFLVP